MEDLAYNCHNELEFRFNFGVYIYDIMYACMSEGDVLVVGSLEYSYMVS